MTFSPYRRIAATKKKSKFCAKIRDFPISFFFSIAWQKEMNFDFLSNNLRSICSNSEDFLQSSVSKQHTSLLIPTFSIKDSAALATRAWNSCAVFDGSCIPSFTQKKVYSDYIHAKTFFLLVFLVFCILYFPVSLACVASWLRKLHARDLEVRVRDVPFTLRALSALLTTKNPILLFNACLINDFFPNTQLYYSVFFCVLLLEASHIKLVYTHAMIHLSPLISPIHKCLLLGRKGYKGFSVLSNFQFSF